MVKTERMCCSVGFSKDFIAFFKMKMSQIDTEDDKNSKISLFSKILGIFLKFPTNFVDWNVKNGQQGKNVISTQD